MLKKLIIMVVIVCVCIPIFSNEIYKNNLKKETLKNFKFSFFQNNSIQLYGKNSRRGKALRNVGIGLFIPGLVLFFGVGIPTNIVAGLIWETNTHTTSLMMTRILLWGIGVPLGVIGLAMWIVGLCLMVAGIKRIHKISKLSFKQWYDKDSDGIKTGLVFRFN